MNAVLRHRGDHRHPCSKAPKHIPKCLRDTAAIRHIWPSREESSMNCSPAERIISNTTPLIEVFAMGTPYRADHVGSFLRPAELLKARQEGADPQRLRAIEDRHIQRVLAKQKELGFEIFTDGELRRRNFMTDFIDAVEGFDQGDAVARSWQVSAEVAVSSVTGLVTGKLRQPRGMTAHEHGVLQDHRPGRVKITLPPPNQLPAV